MGETTAARARRSLAARTLPEAFRLTVEDHPDRVAVRTKDDEVSLTWAQLRDRVDALAGGLAGLGVSRGDTVALMLGNRPEFHIADLAVMTLGATPFSIYPTFTAGQIAFVDRRRGRQAGDRRGAVPRHASARRARSCRRSRRSSCVEGDARRRTPSPGTTSRAPIPDFDPEPHWRAVEPEDVLTLIYTSGTTGPPKGVQLVHRNIMAAVRGRRGRSSSRTARR